MKIVFLECRSRSVLIFSFYLPFFQDGGSLQREDINDEVAFLFTRCDNDQSLGEGCGSILVHNLWGIKLVLKTSLYRAKTS